MASKAGRAVHKLHAVTLVRSGIRRPWWEKRTLKVLKLEKLNQTVVHKNSPSLNGQIAVVKNLVKVTPILIKEEDLDLLIDKFDAVNMDEVQYDGNLPQCKSFLDSAGNFDAQGFLDYHNNVLSKLDKKQKETNLNTAVRKKFRKSKKQNTGLKLLV